MHNALNQRRRRRAIEELARFKAAKARGGPPPDKTFFNAWLDVAARLGGDLRRPFAEHPGVFRAVDVICRDMGGVPWRIWSGREDDKREVLEGPWYDLFADPSPDQDLSVIRALTRIWGLLDGEAFWVLGARSGMPVEARAIPGLIEPVRGTRMTELLGPARTLIGWEMELGDGRGKLRLRTDQVVHFCPRPDPDNPRRGMAPLSPIRRSVRTDTKAHLWNEASLDNNAEPGVVLEADRETGFLTKEQTDQLRQQWIDLHGGPGNARKPAILPGGMKVSTLGWTPKDMEFGEQRKWSRFEIASAYGVPLMLMGDMSEVHSKESARVVLKLYWENTVRPLLLDEQRVLDRQLFLGRGQGDTASAQRVWAEPDLSGIAALQTEETERRANAEADRRLGFPLNAINVRHELGYEDQEAGDVGLVSGGLVPVTAIDVQIEDDPPPPPPAPDDSDEPEEDGDPEDDDDRGAPAIRIAKPREIDRAVLWHQYIRGIQRPGEQRMRAAVLGWMRDVRREALRFVERAGRSARDARSLTEAQVLDWLLSRSDAWDEAILAHTTPVTKWVINGSLRRLADQVGAEIPNLTSPQMLRFIERMGARKVDYVSDTVKDQIRRELLEGVGLGENVTVLQERVKAVMNAGASRSLAIARTETGAASTGSRFEVVGELGVTRISWLSSRDGEVRETHQIDGEVREVAGRPFSNGLRYPLDTDGPPGEVVNCRCDWIPEDDGITIL